MAFPTSPTNGQTATVNGINYTYSSTDNAWTVTPGAANLTTTGSATLGSGSSNVVIAATTTSTSTTTGALVVKGGVAVAGELYIANTGDVSANIGSLISNAATQATAINTIDANLGTATTNITTLFSNAAGQANQITGANAAIVTANTGLKSYVDTQDSTITTAWTANAATQAASINSLDANLGTATTNITTLFSNAAGQANQITGANAAIVTANSALVSFVGTINNNLSTAITANTNAANAAIVTANTSLKSYVDTQDSAITTAWTANAATQQTQINSLATGANANVAAYLPGYTGSLGAITTLTTTGATSIGGNLNVSGNLNVTGNVTTFSSNDLVVSDSIIYIADNNSGDVLDIGIVGHFINPGYQHTGLVRDASDGVWKLFANVVQEPSTTVDFTNAIYSPLRIGALTASSGTIAGTTILGSGSSNVVIAATTTSTSSTTGALVVTGGVGITGNLVVDGNVTLGNLLIDDTEFVLFDNADPTKKAQFNLSGLTTNNSVVYSLPPGSSNVSTLVDLVSTQTINGAKTFSSTAINLGSATANSTQQFAYGATVSGSTKTINIGTSGAQGSFTNMTIGPILGYGNVTFQGNAPVLITNSAASTDTTTGALEVVGGVGIGGNLNVGGSAVISVNSSTDALRITQTGAGNAFVVEDSVNPDATAFVITAYGQVGVGNVSPQATLHVKGNSGVGGLHTDFIVEAEGSGNARFFLKTATNNRNWEFFAAGDDGGFGVYDGVGASRRFTILPTGNVGIGVSSPTANLQVSGTTALGTTTTSILNATVGNITTLAATNFSSGNIYFTGTTTGTVSTANVALYDSVTALTTNQTFYPQFSNLSISGNSITGVSAALGFNPSTANLVVGNSGGANVNLKGGATGTSSGINWMFNTDATQYAALRLPYDTRATIGLELFSGGYPLTLSATNNDILFKINGSEKVKIDGNATGNGVVIATTTASTSSTTGALVVKGGVGVAGQLSVASNITLSESGGTGTRLVFSTSGSGAIINQNDNSDIFLQTQGNTRIQVINGSGIVSFPYGITANSSGIRSTFANVITTNGVYWANGAAYIPPVSSTNYASAANVSLYESVTATTTNATHYPMLSGIDTGNTASFTASGLTYNPSTNTLTTSIVSATGNIYSSGTYGIRVNGAGGTWFWLDNPTASTFRLSSGVGPGDNPITYTSAGNLVIGATTTSVSTTTGALVVKGGVGVTGTLSATTLAGTLSTAAQPNITSVGTLTGLTVNAQFSGNTAYGDSDPGNYDGGQIIAFANQNNITGVSFSPTDRRILTMGIGPVRRPFLRTGAGVPFELATGNVIISSTTASTSSTTGALVVAGGVGVAGNVNIGGGGAAGATVINITSNYPKITAPTYIEITNGLYVSSGTTYTQGALAARGTIINDTGTKILTIGSTSPLAVANTTVSTSTTTGALTVAGGVGIAGALNATTKSFIIDHPTKPGMMLRYGSLEGPEFGVYVRGRLTDSNIIKLPDYWTGLVDPDSITVQLTPIGRHQNLYVEDITDNKVVVGNGNLLSKSINCFYVVFAERKDVDKLEVETK